MHMHWLLATWNLLVKDKQNSSQPTLFPLCKLETWSYYKITQEVCGTPNTCLLSALSKLLITKLNCEITKARYAKPTFVMSNHNSQWMMFFNTSQITKLLAVLSSMLLTPTCLKTLVGNYPWNHFHKCWMPKSVPRKWKFKHCKYTSIYCANTTSCTYTWIFTVTMTD